jgi:hypothetical protein
MEPSRDSKAESESGLRRGQYSLLSLFVLTTLVAVVCGLVKWHGGGVLVVIAWNAFAALIALAVGRKKRKAAAASLLSVFAGWSVVVVVLVVRHGVGGTVMAPGIRVYGPIDFGRCLLLPAILACLGWALLVLSTIALARADGLLYSPWSAPMVWTGLALLACVIFVGALAANQGADFKWESVWEFWPLVLFAAVNGVVAGALFPWLAKSRCPTYLLFSGPSILSLSFWCLLWPTLEYLTPDLTYAYGTMDARLRSLHRVFQSIGPGNSMRATDLHRRFPEVYYTLRPAENGEAGLIWTTERYYYRCRVQIDRATGSIKSISSELRAPRPSDFPPGKNRFIY